MGVTDPAEARTVRGAWALPGGFVDVDETLEESARRELREETGVEVGELEQLQTFGDPGRDPRGRTVSVVYLGRADPRQVKPQAQDDAAAVAWHSLRRPPRLAFDHAAILALVRRKLAATPRRGRWRRVTSRRW